MSFQQITIIGHVGKTNAIRYTPNGKAVTDFSMAVNSKFGDTERTDWYKVTLWNGRTELAQHISKGDQVFVQGTPRTEIWTDKDGKPQARINIDADTVRFLSSKKSD